MSPFHDLGVCLRFFSRLPVPPAWGAGDRPLAQAGAMASLAGAIVGLGPALLILVADGLGLPPLPCAILAVAAVIGIGGGLHEDGLADCADGFGARATRDRKLEIMRDSRIGSFGTCALVVVLMLRASALAAAIDRSAWLGATALIAAASLSRAAALLPSLLLPPARTDGLGHAAGRADPAVVAIALGIAILLSLPVLPFGAGWGALAAAVYTPLVCVVGLCGLAWRQIGGQTGDVAGAAQQVAETAMLLVFAAAHASA